MTIDQKPINVPRRRQAGMPYADISKISQDDAESEPPEARTFPDDRRPTTDTVKPVVTLAATIQHRGRLITITTTDMTADQFCDLLDRRGFAPPEQPQQWQTLPDGTPICPKHHAPMRLREKQGDQWYSHNVGTKEQPIYCKGYHGKDSPGYEQ